MNNNTELSSVAALAANITHLERFSDNEAERAVLGILLKNNGAYDVLTPILRDKAVFYSLQHGLIYNAIETIYQRGGTADVITVADLLLAHGFKKDIKAVIGSMAQNSPPVDRGVEYARIIANHATSRRVYEGLASTLDQMTDPKKAIHDPSALLGALENKIGLLREAMGSVDGNVVTLAEAVSQTLADLEVAQQSDRPIIGLETGIVDLDELTTGLHPGDFVLVAGRPSMGKTALAMNIADHAAFVEKELVVIYSLEMAAKSLSARMLASRGEVDLQAMRTGKIKDQAAWDRLHGAVAYLAGNPADDNMIIDQTAALNIVEMRSRSRRISKQRRIGLIVVDYLQLITAYGSSENDRTTEISRGLKAMAKENNCPVIALCQLNRALELRNDKRPIMSDLRGSGSLEQDADVIVFIYRDEVYNANSSMAGMAELIIGKQRNGPIADIVVAYQGKHTKFSNLAA